MKSKVFVFEGVDFTGKSTVSQHCKEELEKFFPGEVVHYRAPGGTALGEKVRDIARIEAKTTSEQIYAYMLSLTSLKDQILEDIKADKIILVDRWFPSLWCYQLSFLEENEEERLLRHLTSLYAEQVQPNYLLFHVSLKEMEQRLRDSKKADTVDRFEQSSVEYRQKIHKAYSELFSGGTSGIYFKDDVSFIDTDLYSLEICKIHALGLITDHLLKAHR